MSDRDNIKAVVFDFGRVIANFNNEKFIKIIEPYSQVKNPGRILYENSDVVKRYETGQITSEQFYSESCRLCGTEMPIEKFRKAYTNIFSINRGTENIIRRLQGKYTLGLLSNTSEWDYEDMIKKEPVFQLFDTVTTSFEVGHKKPHPAIYQDALTKLELDSEECVYIDDILEYVKAAQELGFKGIQFESPEQLEKALKELGVHF